MVMNIALLEFVQPICLPYEDDAAEDYQTSQAMKDSKFWVAGWGATNARGNYLLRFIKICNPRKK